MLLLSLVLTLASSASAQPPTARILTGGFYTDSVVIDILAKAAISAGYTPLEIGLSDLTNTFAQNDILLIPNARTLPLSTIPAIENYLNQGGHLLLLGAPAWSNPSSKIGDRWLTRAEIQAEMQSITAKHPLFDLSSISNWTRYSDNTTSPTTHTVETDSDRPVLHTRISHLTGWDTFACPELPKPLPPRSLTCFRAKGSSNTRTLLLEWRERDESRWLATVELTTNWKNYVLTPSDFRPWSPPPGRGGPTDSLKMENANRFIVGVAVSHSGFADSSQEYWFGDFGVETNQFADVQRLSQKQLPQLEAISPDYRFYEITGLGSIVRSVFSPLAATNQIIAVPEKLLAFHPRASAVGFDQKRKARWQPLLNAYSSSDASTDVRGTIAVILANQPQFHPADHVFRRGIIAAFTPETETFYSPKPIRALLTSTLIRMRSNISLHDGGAEFFTAFEGQPIRLGATIAQTGDCTNCHVSLEVRSSNSVVFARDWNITSTTNSLTHFEQTWTPTSWPTNGFIVTVRLWQNSQLIDQLQHELNVWRPPTQPHFVTVTNGGFQLNGKPWKAHGVNYMPSSGIALDTPAFEHWVGTGAYDPEIIQRDLNHIRDIGFNSVSVFVYYQSLKTQHMLDFLRRCENLGIKVNLSLRPGTPLDFRWNEMKALIEHYRMASNDTILAYDLAWEPSHFDHAYQKRYTKDWNRWLLNRCTSLNNATNNWTFSPQTVGINQADIPEASQLFNDGPWRKMIADYRLFLDEMLGTAYSDARAKVLSIDPNHPVSFRMQHAGDPTHTFTGLLPYDFYGLRNAVDIWEPEAYGRVGDWSRVKAGAFTAAYAHLCNPNLPVVWAEVGYDIWSNDTMHTDPQKVDFCTRYFRDFYKMLNLSGADGVFFWWYPGGFRLYENSDYGLINPDGPDRPTTKVIREEGARFLKAPKPNLSPVAIPVDRDADARALPAMYEKASNTFWTTLDHGQQPQLQWLHQPVGAK